VLLPRPIATPPAAPERFATARTNSPRQAAHEWRDEIRRQHMLDLASTYQRTADALAPPSPRELLIEHLRERTALSSLIMI
jgi:hypothetical protein